MFWRKKVSYMGANSVVLLELRAKEWVLAHRHCPYIINFSADELNLLGETWQEGKELCLSNQIS